MVVGATASVFVPVFVLLCVLLFILMLMDVAVLFMLVSVLIFVLVFVHMFMLVLVVSVLMIVYMLVFVVVPAAMPAETPVPVAGAGVQHFSHYDVAEQTADRGDKHDQAFDWLWVDNPLYCLGYEPDGQSPDDQNTRKGSDNLCPVPPVIH